MDIKSLIAKMTLKEKLMQLTQLNAEFFLGQAGAEATGPMADLGLTKDDLSGIHSTLNFRGTDKVRQVQEKHLAADKHKIPMSFMMDVVHGCRTIYPLPIGMGATFSPETMADCCEMAARESLAMGINVTFSPMVDLARDARWGRIAETTGEDPLLNCDMAKAEVEGYHRGGLQACVKHYAAYGAAEAGRDYNTVDMSERTLREYYLPSYKAAVDAGVDMVMTSFNSMNGIPSAGNEWLVKGILRDEWGFDKMIISDYNAFRELITHGVAEDEEQAAYMAMKATNDVEMMSATYLHCMEKLIDDGKISVADVDKAVERALRNKEEAGLFDAPHGRALRESEEEAVLTEKNREIARIAAEKSAVLLKNDGVLPFSDKVKRVAVIGPFAATGEIMGIWRCYGDGKDTVTVLDGVKKLLPDASVRYTQGVGGEIGAVADKAAIKEAVTLAATSDAVILTLGEPQGDSGEGNSKLDLELGAAQYELLDAVVAANKNTAVLLFSGRPLAITRLSKTAPAILEIWQPGTEGGSAAANLMFGKVVPEGKLPASFPAFTGQCPIYYNRYNTGRPVACDTKRVAYSSSYIDGPVRPLYPFGYGLSYTTFGYSELKVSDKTMKRGGTVTVSARVKNEGKVTATETAQLYVRDLVGSCVRPIKELKGYKKLTLTPGAEKTVAFEITEDMLAFYGADMKRKAESGEFRAFIGGDSETAEYVTFALE